MQKKGKFIVLEGGEGAGKGTCIKYLEERLAHLHDKVVFTREPGGTEYGEKIRSIFLSQEMKGKISVLSELYTFCAIRANHCDLKVRPALDEEKIVICDRFDPSTIAYQIYGQEHREFADIFNKINAISKGQEVYSEVIPDLVIFLDIDPEIGVMRAKGRGDEATRFDVSKLEFHQRVREGYLNQFENNTNWVRVDASQSIENVEKHVWEAVSNMLDR